MNYPHLSAGSEGRRIINGFGGITRSTIIKEGNLADAVGLSSDCCPMLTAAKPHQLLTTLSAPGGMTSAGGLWYINNGTLYHSTGSLPGSAAFSGITDGSKTILAMGAYILVFPDGLWYNTADSTHGALAQTNTVSGATLTPVLWNSSTASRSSRGTVTSSATAPTSPTDGMLWLDTGSNPQCLKRYNASSLLWVEVSGSAVLIAATGIGSGLAAYDGVHISGLGSTMTESDFIIYDAGADYIVVPGILSAQTTLSGTVTVSRSLPECDCYTVSGNRVWGCSSSAHEVYASRLCDPFNWNAFEGIASDSYALTVGRQEAFTGAAALGGYVYFFTPETVLRISGTLPSNYRLTDLGIPGVATGCADSLCSYNGCLMWYSSEGLLSWDGSDLVNLSEALGEALLTAVSCTCAGGKLYMSGTESGTGMLYVLDLDRGVWLREESESAIRSITVGNRAYWLSGSGRLTASGGSGTPGGWYLITGALCAEGSSSGGGVKRIRRLRLRLGGSSGSTVTVKVRYDRSGDWVTVGGIAFTSASAGKAVDLPLAVRLCDALELRLEGSGEVSVISTEVRIRKING